jgi:tryptophan-rich sensory protein
MTAIASKSQLRMSFLRYALFTVPLVLLLGTVSGRIANSGYGNAWFDALEKPEIMPPGWLFGVAWDDPLHLPRPRRGPHPPRPRRPGPGPGFEPVRAPAPAQLRLVADLLRLSRGRSGFWTILAMILIAAVTAALFWRIRRVAALLMLPYLAWLCFAALLTWQIGLLNPNAAELAPGGSTTDIAI